MSLPLLLTMVRDAHRPCLDHPFTTRLAGSLASAFVLVVGSHVTDAGVQPDCVVVGPFAAQLSLEISSAVTSVAIHLLDTTSR